MSHIFAGQVLLLKSGLFWVIIGFINVFGHVSISGLWRYRLLPVRRANSNSATDYAVRDTHIRQGWSCHNLHVYLQCDIFACAMQQQYKRLWPVDFTLLAVQVLVRPQSVE